MLLASSAGEISSGELEQVLPRSTGPGPWPEVRWLRAELVARRFDVKFAAHRLPVHDAGWATKGQARVGRAVTLRPRTRSR